MKILILISLLLTHVGAICGLLTLYYYTDDDYKYGVATIINSYEYSKQSGDTKLYIGRVNFNISGILYRHDIILYRINVRDPQYTIPEISNKFHALHKPGMKYNCIYNKNDIKYGQQLFWTSYSIPPILTLALTTMAFFYFA